MDHPQELNVSGTVDIAATAAGRNNSERVPKISALWSGVTPLSDVLKPNLAQLLAEDLGVISVVSLLSYIPKKYISRKLGSADFEDSHKVPIADGDRITVVGVIDELEFPRGTAVSGGKPQNHAITKMKYFRIIVRDFQRKYSVTFFHPRKLLHLFHPGQTVVLDGTVSFFRGVMQLTHPEWIILPENSRLGDEIPLSDLSGSKKALGLAAAGTDSITVGDFFRPIIPQYQATKSFTSWEIWGILRYVLAWAKKHNISDPLTEDIRTDLHLPSLLHTWEILHDPENLLDISAAKRRIAVDEAFAIQFALDIRKQNEASPFPSPELKVRGAGLRTEFIHRLPFCLTKGQQTAIAEIDADMASAEPMNRLLQGEVGSGKTIIALLAMLNAIDNGYQCCFLAPTEVLAAQHHQTFVQLLSDLAIQGQLGAHTLATRVELFTGSMSTKSKREALLHCVSGDAGIVVGTHALLEDKVDFFRLGMIVIDEQHRFGVQQRDKLKHKAIKICPHTLVMTATPIPRTVALTKYGDLKVSILKELPKGRQAIKTIVVPLATRPQWWSRIQERIGEEIIQQRQIYVVFPAINTDDTPESLPEQLAAPQLLAVENFYQALCSSDLAKYRIAIMHGKLFSEEKNRVMREFVAGEIDILLATTVIEVGVDVPNASMMIIMDAERFGVSQLHQLRGRIGRGSAPGLCLILTRQPPGAPSLQRLEAVAATNDGFALSLVDLAQRREGDVLGDAQSGVISSFQVLSLLNDEDIINYAYNTIQNLSAHRRDSSEFRKMYDAYSQLIAAEKIRYLDMA